MFALQVVTTRDIQSLCLAVGLLAVVVVVSAIFRQQIKSLLTTREWRIFFKLLGIVVLALLLYFTSISVQFPAEKFIYGRF